MSILLGLLAGIALGRATEDFEMRLKYYWYCCENCKDFGEYVEKDKKY